MIVDLDGFRLINGTPSSLRKRALFHDLIGAGEQRQRRAVFVAGPSGPGSAVGQNRTDGGEQAQAAL
jgi:hypothetical protein